MIKKEYPRLGEEMYQETLDNGLTIFVVEKPEFQKSYGFFATNYGGMDLRYSLDGTSWVDSPSGVAHFLEHKLFDTPEGNALQDLAANGASPNAFTSSSMTGYYFECTEHFIKNLETLLSFVSVPWFTQESVDKEQGIIAQEIDMIQDEPGWRVYHNLLECLYAHHPVRGSIAGTAESIAQISAQTLYDCHKAFYQPANMVLTVAGNVKAAEVVEAAKRILPQGEGVQPRRDYGPAEEAKVQETLRTETMEVASPLFRLGFKGDSLGTGLEAYGKATLWEFALDALVGTSSPLYHRLYEEGLFTSLNYGCDQFEGGCYLHIGGESKDPQKIQEAVMAEVERISREGIDPALWERIQKGMYGGFVRGLNSLEGICIEQAEMFFQGCDLMEFPQVFDGVTREAAETALKTWLTAQRSALSVIQAKGA